MGYCYERSVVKRSSFYTRESQRNFSEERRSDRKKRKISPIWSYAGHTHTLKECWIRGSGVKINGYYSMWFLRHKCLVLGIYKSVNFNVIFWKFLTLLMIPDRTKHMSTVVKINEKYIKTWNPSQYGGSFSYEEESYSCHDRNWGSWKMMNNRVGR